MIHFQGTNHPPFFLGLRFCELANCNYNEIAISAQQACRCFDLCRQAQRVNVAVDRDYIKHFWCLYFRQFMLNNKRTEQMNKLEAALISTLSKTRGNIRYQL